MIKLFAKEGENLKISFLNTFLLCLLIGWLILKERDSSSRVILIAVISMLYSSLHCAVCELSTEVMKMRSALNTTTTPMQINIEGIEDGNSYRRGRPRGTETALIAATIVAGVILGYYLASR